MLSPPPNNALARHEPKTELLGPSRNRELKRWRILRKIRCCPLRATSLVKPSWYSSSPSNGVRRAVLAGSAPVAAGGSALPSTGRFAALASDRAPVGRGEA